MTKRKETYVVTVVVRGYIIKACAAFGVLKACRRANEIEEGIGMPLVDGWSVEIARFNAKMHAHLFSKTKPSLVEV